jgi:hypothetical protein
MWQKEIIPDKSINQKVTQQLSARGLRAPCHIAVRTAKGVVTLSGDVEYEHQRNTAVQSTRRLDGVSSVVDQLRVKPKAPPQEHVFIPEDPPLPKKSPVVPGAAVEAKALLQSPKPACR